MANSRTKRRINPQPLKTVNLYTQITTTQQVIDAALADATVLAFLSDYGCTTADLQQGLHLCLAAQQTQRSADESLAALNGWMARFVLLARAALQQRPDLMNQLDI